MNVQKNKLKLKLAKTPLQGFGARGVCVTIGEGAKTRHGANLTARNANERTQNNEKMYRNKNTQR